MTTQAQFSLDHKYVQETGRVILSGVQALVRLPLDQLRADRQAGLKTATLISGYRGSPLGGLDMALQQNQPLLREHNIVFLPDINEDLGATAVFGSQLANLMPQPRYDGVLGMWYGKSPGVDRSGDIFKHANFTGVGRYGGVLAVAGDDPTAKSSTLPSHSEVALYDAQMPVLYPGNVQEVIELGRYGFELSRYSGAWVGLKMVTNVADEFGTAELYPIQTIIKPEFTFDGKPWQHSQNPTLVAPFSLHLEREIYEGRLEAAQRFAAANSLNRMIGPASDSWLGLVAAGKSYYDLREALARLGLDDAGLRRYGIRLLKIGLLYPLEPEIVKTFAQGLEEIFVIEEKRPFIELFLRNILYNQAVRPRVVGKQDELGQPLVRSDAELDADQMVELLVRRLSKKLPPELLPLLPRPEPISLNLAGPALPARTPFFCSGCPHNRSTLVPEGSLAGGGIGCHGMVLMMGRNTQGITHMGGEGVQWVGAAPFTGVEHIFQNLGDGTLFHSGYLAIRQAVAAGTNITYKILYNSAVAMTGGQVVDGNMPVPELTQALHAEGVNKMIICADDPAKYPSGTSWAPGVALWSRDRLDEAQQQLRQEKGVTVLIYDQPCAAELRRKRRRGVAEEPPVRVFINEAVCEGCGDCGVKAHCLSVVPVETEFGRKTQIHQSSCNKDYTCLTGDCPAFVTVIPGVNGSGRPAKPGRPVPIAADELPEPRRKPPPSANIYMLGIGGTGVVTVNQILGTAAFLEGKGVRGLDQTGLSQKGGPVVSHLKIFDQLQEVSNKIGSAAADAYLVFDLLSGTTEANLRQAHPEKTVAVASLSQIPTGAMVTSPAVRFPEEDYLRRRLESRTRAGQNVYLDALGLAERLFGSHMAANMMVIGAAYQAGLLPVRAAAIEQAIALNGVAVEANQQAFRVGRMVVANPEWTFLQEPGRPEGQRRVSPLTPEAQTLIDSTGAGGELCRLLEIRVPELIAYQDQAYARRYVDFVKRVKTAEAGVTAETRLSEAVARYLFKLMAYKDEYEVARLQLRPELGAALSEQFGSGARISYQLQPPFLRALGLKRKIGFGRWFEGGYRLLARLRRLRGTPFDPFGYAHVRKVERALIEEYRALIEHELAGLSPATYEQAVSLANLPDLIRGYEVVKLNNVARFREAVQQVKVGISGSTPGAG